MSTTDSLRRTALYSAHVDAGGRLVPFAGWELPIQYEGVIAEHRAVRSSGGVFDVSHMGQFTLTGSGAFADLQHLLSNDVARLTEPGMAQYTLLTSPEAGILDDVILYRTGDASWLVVVNAANREADAAWFRSHVGSDTDFADVSDAWAMLAVQGPLALDAVRDVLGVDLVETRPFRLVQAEFAGTQLVAATTGYTGERGCELLIAPEHAIELWNALLADERLVPAGLGARDTLRLEACYPLHGNDISADTTPAAAGLMWACAPTTGFIGADVLQDVVSAGPTERLAAVRMADRGIPRAGCPCEIGGVVVGRVTSGTLSPTLGYGIALAYVEAAHASVGTQIEIDVRGRRYAAEVVAKPLYTRES